MTNGHMIDRSLYTSKRGISFAERVIKDMRDFVKTYDNKKCFFQWVALPDFDGNLHINLRASEKLSPDAIDDEIDGMVFYWVGQQRDIEIIRKNHCIDCDIDSKQIKLTPKEL
jgi:hypothetical protein